MNKKLIKAELFKRLDKKASTKVFKIEDYCFDKQIAFIQDPNRFKDAVCSRRSGKSVSCAADLISTALNYPGDVVYITLDRKTAKKILWRTLLQIIKQYNLQAKIDNTELIITFPNGNNIYVSGAKDSSEIEKFRGLALRKVYIDEVQSFRSYIKDLVEDVIEPALTDYNGSLILIGTPGPVPAGFFYDASHSPGWSHHHWTMQDNPHIKIKSGRDPLDIITELASRRGLSITDPSIQREYFGKWEKDENSLVYKFDKQKNIIIGVPDNLQYIFGIDIGWNDADAIAVLGYSTHTNNVYLVEEWVKSKQTIGELVEEIKRLQEKYEPVKMVMDAGALGKKIQEEILQRYGMNIEAAEKTRKHEFISLLNDDLRTGAFKAVPNTRFEEDCNLVQWDYDNPEKPVISTRYHSDVCFVAGTKIQTIQGPKNIEDIKPGNMVLTRQGYFPVEWSSKTGLNKSVLRLVFSDGNTLTCTPNHPIYTKNRGFVPAENLTRYDEFYNILTWEKTREKTLLERQLFLKVRNFTDILFLREAIAEIIFTAILKEVKRFYTGLYGKTPTAPYRKAMLFIMKTKTLSTTTLRILGAYLKKNILKSIESIKEIGDGLKKTYCDLKKFESWPSSGTVARLVLSGINNTPFLGKKKTESKLQKCAQSAVFHTCATRCHREKKASVQIDVTRKIEDCKKSTMLQKNANGAVKCFEPVNMENNNSVVGLVMRETLMQKEDVYNISINGPSEYFANNILVHNCDSVLYAWKECRHYFKPEPKKAALSVDQYMKELEDAEAEEMEAALKGQSDFTDVTSWDDLGITDTIFDF